MWRGGDEVVVMEARGLISEGWVKVTITGVYGKLYLGNERM